MQNFLHENAHSLFEAFCIPKNKTIPSLAPFQKCTHFEKTSVVTDLTGCVTNCSAHVRCMSVTVLNAGSDLLDSQFCLQVSAFGWRPRRDGRPTRSHLARTSGLLCLCAQTDAHTLICAIRHSRTREPCALVTCPHRTLSQ
jgi:hypothetical protein